MNILTYHLHFALWLRKELVVTFNNHFNLKLEPDHIIDIVNELDNVEDELIERYLNTFTFMKVDNIYLNSY